MGSKASKNDVRAKVRACIREQQSQIVGHDAAVEGAYLAIGARVPAMFIGPPGIGKSQIIDGVLDRMMSVPQFRTTFNEFMTVDEFIGPVSFANLRKDEFKRDPEGYIPSAWIAFIDEWSRCTGPLASTMLNLLNEGHYFDGQSRQMSTLKATLLACNYLPDEEEAFGAVLDRLVMRFYVNRIDADDTNLRTAILMGDKPTVTTTLTQAEIEQMWAEIDAVTVGAEIAQMFVAEQLVPALAKASDAMFTRCSDRRIHRGLRVAQAKAWLDGSTKVEQVHCSVYANIVWNELNEIDTAQEIVASLIGVDGMRMAGNSLPEELSVIVDAHRMAMDKAGEMVGEQAVKIIEEVTSDALSKMDDIKLDWTDKFRNVSEKEMHLSKLNEATDIINDQMATALDRITEAV